ncbi:hypothetical protein [Atrimonas thermophila]|uniref:hypothetical protein n=1 Tax=Atrimonas thermophila TaxID=3064161 RepID=UPI00399C8EA3
MKHFFFIPEKALEEKVTQKLQEEIRNLDPQAEVTIYPALDSSSEKEYRQKSKSPFTSLTEFLNLYLRFRRYLRPRKQLEETELVYFGNRLSYFFLLHFLAHKKIIWVRVSRDLNERRISFFQKLMISKSVEVILTDDQRMNRHYRQNLLPSYFVGNILVDLCPPSSFEFLHGKNPILAFFPKTQEFEEELLNALELTEVLCSNTHKHYFLLVIPKGVSTKKTKEIAEKKAGFIVEVSKGTLLKDIYGNNPSIST